MTNIVRLLAFGAIAWVSVVSAEVRNAQIRWSVDVSGRSSQELIDQCNQNTAHYAARVARIEKKLGAVPGSLVVDGKLCGPPVEFSCSDSQWCLQKDASCDVTVSSKNPSLVFAGFQMERREGKDRLENCNNDLGGVKESRPAIFYRIITQKDTNTFTRFCRVTGWEVVVDEP